MNTIIQNILILVSLGLAVWFLVHKFFLKKPRTDKGCGSGDDCGCH